MTELSIGDRMKENYENRYRIKLTRRMPVIIRLDGKTFHSLTHACKKPFDEKFSNAMINTASYLCHEIQGAKCAYVQSDEISLLLTDFDTLTTEAWFDYNLQKMASVSAGMASSFFTLEWTLIAVFDSRIFNIPREEVCNYFIWRQKDWERNSIQMLAQAHFSHKHLHKKSNSDMHEMLHEKNVNWTKLDGKWKNGWFIHKEEAWVHEEAPIFTENRNAIEDYLKE